MRSLNLLADNDLTILHCGAEYFPALVTAFDSASAQIYLESYIFAADATGTLIKEALMRAAARGVQVNVTVDWHGTGNRQATRLFEEFSQAGVHCRIFNPWFKRGVSRSHRKICVVDRQVGFIGGLNINDDLVSDTDVRLSLPAARWDFAVQVRGPLVAQMQQEVEAQWARIGSLKLRSRLELFREVRQPPSKVGAAGSGIAALAALVVRDNLRNRRTIQRAYLQALGHARHSVLLTNPYFAPGRKMRVALSSAAARGVDVTLLLGVGEFRLQDAVTRALYPKLLKSGVKIVEYHKTQLHAKVAVVDDHWSTIGSSNYDGFSLFVNQEANVVVEDAAFARTLRAKIEQGIADGVPVLLTEFVNLPWHRRLGYNLAFGAYRFTMKLITWGSFG